MLMVQNKQGLWLCLSQWTDIDAKPKSSGSKQTHPQQGLAIDQCTFPCDCG
jgi:hypothetical protein